MKTFTIDTDNNITVFASKKEAAAASTTPFDPFTSQSELAELAAAWPMNRLVEIWNATPGVNAITKFTNRKIATERIWKAIQNLGSVAPPATGQEVVVDAAPLQAAMEQPKLATETETALAEPVADVGAQVPDVAPVAADSAPKPTRAKKAPRKGAQPEASGPREGSKTAQVVAMLERKDGATLAEIMEKMGWQKHTVRGFMAGAMKKAGYAVESFKPEGGERTYRITK
jgi:hypothetical protein